MGRVMRAVRKWNAFRDAPQDTPFRGGGSMSARQARSPGNYYSDKSIVTAIYTRMAIDVSSIEFMHVKLDQKTDVVKEIVRDSLHECLTLDPNIDQSAQFLKADAAMTMFQYGEAAIVPIEADFNPLETESYKISDMRVGRVVGWAPQEVCVEVYDDRDKDDENNPINGGINKQIWLPKRMVAIVENPFYNVMNAPNGLFQRLIRKMAILDGIDEAAGSGKLDLIFQLPYTVRSESRAAQAEARRKALAEQLKDDELGIGYIDVSEKVIQLNRPVENKLIDQIEYLIKAIKTELGITDEIMNSTAPLDAIAAYMDRTIEPIANAMALEMKRKFLTKTARSQRHSIEIYRDPLKLIPFKELAEFIDKARRNAVVTSNEIRPKIGLMPSDDPAANALGNPNMPAADQLGAEPPKPNEEVTNDPGLPDGSAEQ